MKNIFLIACLSVFTLCANAQVPVAGQPQPTEEKLNFRIADCGANHRIFKWETAHPTPLGTTEYQTHTYTELATGLNYRDAQGNWQETKEEFETVPGWAVARKGPHKVALAYNLNTAGAVAITMPDGQVMRGQVLGLSYLDPGTGQSVLLADLKDCVGKVISPNQVLYEDAFTDVKADVRFTYTKAGIEQDIILREQLPDPGLIGMKPATTRIAVMTEFINPPAGTTSRPLLDSSATDTNSLPDDQVNFGSMWLGEGRAFDVGQEGGTSGAMTGQRRVGKKWSTVGGRTFLLEEIPVSEIKTNLDQLPKQAGLLPKSSVKELAQMEFPARRETPTEEKQLEVASAMPSQPGFVLDYVALNSGLTNYTFQGDMTYYISASIVLSGKSTFEGNAVLKFATNGGLQISPASASPSIVWQAGAYRPVVFTAKDDNSVGENTGTGNPTGYYGNPMLTLAMFSPQVPLTGLRVSYANTAFGCYSGSVTLNDVQFVNCQNGFSLGGANVFLGNVLFANTKTNFVFQGGSTVTAQHVTFNGNSYMVAAPSYNTGCALALTNCVMANVTNLVSGLLVSTNGAYNGFYNSPTFGSQQITTNAYPFRPVGAGSYYLTNGCSFLNAGTTNINSTLLADIRAKTTQPPVVYSSQIFNTPATLTSQGLQDTGLPDLGYHYDIVDYAIGGGVLSTNLDVAAGTTVAWFEAYGGTSLYGQPYGLAINNGGKISFNGTATQPARFVHYHMVQEGNGNWMTRGWLAGLVLNGSGSTPVPEINANFTQWMGGGLGGYFRDAWNYGSVRMANSELFAPAFIVYAPPLYFTNCLFNRVFFVVAGDTDASSVTFLNNTFYNGGMEFKRYTWNSPSIWLIKNCAFDGTCISMYDQLNANPNSTDMDYNSHSSSNLSWATYPMSWYAPNTNVLEMVGAHDITVTNFNWQTGSLGGFYLPSNSDLIDKGNQAAPLVGLHHFTTQTNQVRELGSVVDIGYHYVALDGNGVPPDSDIDGTPDYMEVDSDKDGVSDVEELLQGRNFAVAGSVADTNSTIGLLRFTPLK